MGRVERVLTACRRYVVPIRTMVRTLETHYRTYPEVFFPSQQQPERFIPSLLLQRYFLLNTWGPLTEQIGMTRDQAMAVWGKWCMALGSVFKETKVEEGEFGETVLRFAENMITHLQALKYYMHTTDWNDVVTRVEAASATEFEFLMKSGKSHLVTIDSGQPPDDPSDEVRISLMHVYLPNAETPGEARVRVPFAAKGVEMRQSSIEVTNNVMHSMREEVRRALGVLAH